jgi:hypothetical protein
MEIVYTFHAKEKIEFRKIHLVWTEEALRSPDLTKKIGYKYKALKRLNSKSIEVVYLKEESYIKILTAYWR